jgi:hypothetical protein
MLSSVFDVLVLVVILLIIIWGIVLYSRRSKRKTGQGREAASPEPYRPDHLADAMVRLNPKWQARKEAMEVQQAAGTEAARLADLAARFGERDARRVIAGDIWVGQTAEMLRAALGEPAAVDERVQPAKAIQIWKYQPNEQGRYGMRVMLEDGVVASWSSKNR